MVRVPHVPDCACAAYREGSVRRARSPGGPARTRLSPLSGNSAGDERELCRARAPVAWTGGVSPVEREKGIVRTLLKASLVAYSASQKLVIEPTPTERRQ